MLAAVLPTAIAQNQDGMNKMAVNDVPFMYWRPMRASQRDNAALLLNSLVTAGRSRNTGRRIPLLVRKR